MSADSSGRPRPDDRASRESGDGGGKRSSVRVTILGDEYTIRSEASPAHTRDVAAHVDRVIRQVLAAGTVVETHKVAILAALQITDELFRERAQAADLTKELTDLSADVRRWLPPNKRSDAAT